MLKKKSKDIRLGDLIRTMWKVEGKTKVVCLHCEWRPTKGIGYPNATREARAHTRDRKHLTRVASVEIVEYRVKR